MECTFIESKSAMIRRTGERSLSSNEGIVMQSRLLQLALISFLGLSPFCVLAQTGFELGGQAGAASRMGFAARGLAAANALSAVAAGDGISYYNPALVPYQSQPTALVSTGFLSLDRNLNYVSYVQRLKPSGGFSVSLINSVVSNIHGRNLESEPTEAYQTSENEFLFSFGVKLREDFSIGVSAKILYFSLFRDVKSTTVGFDVGLLYFPTKDWTVALVVGDINSKYKWDTSQLYGREGTTTIDKFPLRRKLAASYGPEFLS